MLGRLGMKDVTIVKSNFIYMTHDDMEGFLWFISNEIGIRRILFKGELQEAKVNSDASVTWIKVPDPFAKEKSIIEQIPEATVFKRRRYYLF